VTSSNFDSTCDRADYFALSAEPDSLGSVKNPATLFAAYDFLAAFHSHGRLRGDFHVATGANIVLERNNCRIAFARKKPFETIEHIFLNFARQFGAIFHQFLELHSQGLVLAFEISHLPRDGILRSSGFFFLGRDFCF
jgi:hypothetical protein